MSNRTILLLAGLLWLCPLLVQAHDFACGTNDDAVTGGLRVYRPSLPPPQAEADCVPVVPSETHAQRALVASTDRRKLRVDSAAQLVRLKSQAVRDQIDAADAERQAAAQEVAAELASPGCASGSLAEAQHKIHTQFEEARATATAITNPSTAKAAALAIIDKSELVLEQLARCFYGMLRRR